MFFSLPTTAKGIMSYVCVSRNCANFGSQRSNYLDLNVHHTLLIVKFIIIVWVHLKVVEGEFLLDALLESLSLFQGQRVGLGNHRNNVDDIGELLEDDDIDWLQTRTGCQYRYSEHSLLVFFFNIRMAGRLNKEQAAVNTSILDITLTLSCELFAEVGGVLIFDVFDNWVPAVSRNRLESVCKFSIERVHAIPSVIVHLVAISGGVDNVQPQTDSVFLDD